MSAAQRAGVLGHSPLTIWLTGLSASGKSTIAQAMERRLVDLGVACFVLDGDNLRHGLNSDLGFSPADRRENIRRAAEVARLLNDAGLVAIAAFISPYLEDRAMARRIVGDPRFFEVHLAADLGTCERRDPRGLYSRARKGEIPDFTGIGAPYEPPQTPELAIDTAGDSLEACVERLWAAVRERLCLPPAASP